MAFALRPQWYRETAEEAIDHLATGLGPLTGETAWRYLYACVGWFEEIGTEKYLHLNDRLSSRTGKEQARRGAQFLEQHLSPSGVPAVELLDQIGRRYDDERERQGNTRGKWQRNNITGNAFEATLQVLIHRITGSWPSRTPRLNTLRGFELAPAGYHSRPDLAMFSARDFRLLISTKWTLRKERIGTYLHEAYFYKQRRPDLQVAFVVGEFNLNILEWLMYDPLVDRVYHLHLPMLLHVHQPFADLEPEADIPLSSLLERGRQREAYGRWLAISERLFDLSQLFADIELLRDKGEAPQLDPEIAADGDENQP